MPMSITLYHNPNCSKSRLSLQLLQDKGLDFELIEYLKNPPSTQQLEQILTLLDVQPREFMRTQETEYTTLNLANPDLSREQLILAMVNNPKLIERPVVLANGKAAIGRPIDNILAIL